MLKRILSILVVCSLLLGAIHVFAEEVAEESAVYEYELLPGAYDIVTALGICEYEEKDMNATITRGEFAKVVSLLCGFGEGNKSANMFSDVPATHKYAGYINGLAKAGVVSGYKGTGYSPDTAVSFNEAVTTVVRAMGYAAKAENQGGYPYGYITVAKRLGLLDNLTASNAAITKAEVIQLAFNALEADAMVAEGLINGEVSYGTYKDYTLGDYVFGMVHITGKVEAVDISSIRGENDLDSEQILIDGIEILAEEKILWDYLGYEVDAWYITDKSGIKNLVHIEKTNYNKVIEIPVTDISSINKGEIIYYDSNNKKEEASFKIAGPVVYNTASTYEAFNMDMIKNADGGKVTLISNDGDKVADVVIVEAYTDYVVSALYATEMTLYDKFNAGTKIKLDTTTDDPYTIIYDSEGKELGFSGVKLGDVVSVYASMDDADQKFIKAVAHSNSVEGVVSEVTYVDDVAEVTIDEVSYKLTKRCFENRKKFVQAGAALKLVLNTEGRVCDLVSISAGLNFAYLIALDEGKGLDSKLSVKLLNMDGSFSVYDLATNVTVDTNVYKNGYRNGKFILDALVESSKAIFPDATIENCIAQPVQYRAADGKLSSIDTLLNSEGSKATRGDIKGFDMLYHLGQVRGSVTPNVTPGPRRGNNYAGKFLATNTTPVICIPSVEDAESAAEYLNEDEYSFTTPASGIFPDSSNIRFWADAFSVKEDSFSADFIITTKGGGAASIGEESYFAVVQSIRNSITADDEEAYCVVAGTKDGETKLYFEDNFEFTIGTNTKATVKDLKEGDCFRYATNSKGYVSGVEFDFRASTGEIFKSTSFSKEANGLAGGYVHQALTDGFTFLEGSTTIAEIAAADPLSLTLTQKNGLVYVYDFNEIPGRRVKPASADDIMGYNDVGTDCSFVFVNGNRSKIYITLLVNGFDYADLK